MTDYHAPQFDGTACGKRNCGACSCAMAIAFAGGPQLTGAQVRADSGVSCALGVDTKSGGLRIADVARVAAMYGVAINYGGLQSWPETALRARLAVGQGVIVLGEAALAPVQPTVGEVYHSAWCHGLDTAADKTHWHDPRLTQPYWVGVDDVIAYWNASPGGYRYGGFVAPDQIVGLPATDTAPGGTPDMVGTKSAGPAIAFGRMEAGHQLISPQDTKVRFPGPGVAYDVAQEFSIIGVLNLTDPADGQAIDIEGNKPPQNLRNEVYLVDAPAFGAAAFALRADVTVLPQPPTPTPAAVTLGPGLYEVK